MLKNLILLLSTISAFAQSTIITPINPSGSGGTGDTIWTNTDGTVSLLEGTNIVTPSIFAGNAVTNTWGSGEVAPKASTPLQVGTTNQAGPALFVTRNLYGDLTGQLPSLSIFRASTAIGSTGALTNMSAIDGDMLHNGTGTFNDLFGINFASWNVSANSPLGNVIGINSVAYNLSTASNTAAFAGNICCSSFTKQAAVFMARTNYGLYGALTNYDFLSTMEPRGSITDPEKWAFYAQGGAPSYFGGSIETPSSVTMDTFAASSGGSVGGPLLSTSATTNGPSANEFATANWVRSLLAGGVYLYNSGQTNASGFDSPTFAFTSGIPEPGSRVYSNATLSAGSYFGSVMTTNRYTTLSGTAVIEPYITSTGGNSVSYYTVHAEIYYTYDKTNLLGDWDSGSQALLHGAYTNKYAFAVPIPTTTATNDTGFYVVRRMKVDQKFGTGDNLTIYYGTNTPSMVSFPLPAGGSGFALKSGDTFTGDVTMPTLKATKAIQQYQGGLTHAGTVTIDFDAATTVNQITLTGAVTFAFSNVATNRTYRLLVHNYQATNCAVTLPAGGTNFFGGIPGSVTAGKHAMWSMECWGTDATNVMSSWSETQ